ncbi:hypothetical protein BFU36_12170 [Sulfolobus sp. A20]|nr:hypothetical protein BFU36_12170 [Sulfolobus sp. A20]
MEEILKSRGINYQFVKVKDAKTVKDASNSLGIDEGKIAKTVIVIADNKPLAIFLRGNKRVNLEKVKEFLRVSEVRIAKAKEVRELTGYQVGGVPPIIEGVETIVDLDLASDSDYVYCGGGDEKTLLRISPKELVEKFNLKVLNVNH